MRLAQAIRRDRNTALVNARAVFKSGAVTRTILNVSADFKLSDGGQRGSRFAYILER